MFRIFVKKMKIRLLNHFENKGISKYQMLHMVTTAGPDAA